MTRRRCGRSGRRTGRAFTLLEVMLYISCLAPFMVAVGSSFTGIAGTYYRMQARAGVADRLSRVFRALRADAAAGTAARAGLTTPLVIAGAVSDGGAGRDVRWYLEGDHLMRSVGTGPAAVREIVATHVRFFTAKQTGPRLWYVALILGLPSEQRALRVDTIVRVGPPWSTP